jgi:uncharacterized protein YijF (DUF1287 family)
MKKWIGIGILLLFIILLIESLYQFNYIPHKKYTNSDFGILRIISSVDKDRDGIEDYEDILLSVKDYIKTKPKYKSKYYETGYPNDEFGVCTDVVAFGLKGAGYDLMELVYQDKKDHPEEYPNDPLDKNIDFRRVKNLKVYFKRNAVAVTNDINKFNEWQAGDIVIFQNHIGIVSDQRNKKGIPFIIHNANPYQRDYEEDILEQREKEIVGHYKIS